MKYIISLWYIIGSIWNKNQVRPTDGFKKYRIKKGKHYCTTDYARRVSTVALRFRVLFNDTAIYKAVDAVNQYDINKLFGFTDHSISPHRNSARFGWAYCDGNEFPNQGDLIGEMHLRLYAYVYTNGRLIKQQLCSVPLNEEIYCSIEVIGRQYIFSVNGTRWNMPRELQGEARGYCLYPYFGGDEPAPHEVVILIKND